MNNACTVIPIHYPKFNYGYNLLKSYIKNCDVPLYFTFTTIEEMNLFLKNVNPNHIGKFSNIILDQSLINYKNIITVKKFYSVDVLSDTYQYIAVFDSETLFVKPMNNYLIYKEIDDSNFFKGNKRKSKTHLKDLATLMGYENDNRLLEQTQNFSQYWWLNEICVYEKTKFKEFFKWYKNHKNYEKMQNEFFCFDYLIYSIWLICNKNYFIKKYATNIICNGALVETNYSDDHISYEFKSYQDRNINHENIEHIKVQIMLDRDVHHCYNVEGVRIYEHIDPDGRRGQ